MFVFLDETGADRQEKLEWPLMTRGY